MGVTDLRGRCQLFEYRKLPASEPGHECARSSLPELNGDLAWDLTESRTRRRASWLAACPIDRALFTVAFTERDLASHKTPSYCTMHKHRRRRLSLFGHAIGAPVVVTQHAISKGTGGLSARRDEQDISMEYAASRALSVKLRRFLQSIAQLHGGHLMHHCAQV